MYIDLHIKIGLPFSVTLTKYTTQIKSARFNLHFMKNAQSNRVFAAYSKIKADVVKKPVEEINTSILKYYQTNFNFNEIYADLIYNVDIKSAYANILRNDGYISNETFQYISTLPKMERLASVGMLAGRKETFDFDETGKIISSIETVSPTSNYFFYAVARTYEIIDFCKVELGNDFLFSWVDGIYFKNENNGELLRQKLLLEYDLHSSFDTLTQFEIKKNRNHYLLSYYKDDERKLFNIPLPDTTAKQEIYNYLLNKKHKQDENNLPQISL